MKLDGRVITIPQIRSVLDATEFNGVFRPRFVEIHNTSIPDIATFNRWKAAGKPTFEQWLKNLAAYYAGLGWASMPHAFVGPDGRIGLGAPFNVRGTHSPSWNGVAIGIETVGEFEREQFEGTLSEAALVALTGELHLRLGLDPAKYVKGVSGIHFHKEDLKSTHRTCPGKNLNKERFVRDVVEYMANAQQGEGGEHVVVPPTSQEAETGDLTAEELTSTKWLQARLNAHGAKLKVDGIIGNLTRAAVRSFQKLKGLAVDGIAGPLTRTALKGAP